MVLVAPLPRPPSYKTSYTRYSTCCPAHLLTILLSYRLTHHATHHRTRFPGLTVLPAYHSTLLSKVLVAQPRRVAAISLAQRVAAERGEPVGRTVGCQ